MDERRFFTTQCWQKTALGSPIALYSSSPLDNLRGQNPLLLMGGVHGDEPEGVELATATLKWLESLSASNTRLIPWILIPCLNIDGFRQGTRVNGRGVDLNRNYPSSDWSPDCEKPRYFPGPSPASEPEVQGVVQLIREFSPRMVIHCHSWVPCIVYTGEPGFENAKRLAQASGYEMRTEIGYPTPGSLSRFGWHDLKIPIICIEEQEQLTDLSPIWKRFGPAMQEIFTLP